MSNQVEKFFEKNNVTGDLALILKGEEVKLPEEFENVDLYQDHLQEKYEKERTDFVFTKNKDKIDKENEEMIAKKQKDWNAAKENALRNKLLTLGGLDKAEYADTPVKELIQINSDKWNERLDKLSKDKSMGSEEMRKEINDLKLLVQEINIEKESIADQMKIALDTKDKEKEKDILNYIKGNKFTAFVAEILPELSLGNVRVAMDSIEGGLRRYGYVVVAEKDGNDNYKLVAKSKKDLSNAMNLKETKVVDSLKELVLEIAAEDKFLKRKETGHQLPAVAGANIVKDKDGKDLTLVVPTFL